MGDTQYLILRSFWRRPGRAGRSEPGPGLLHRPAPGPCRTWGICRGAVSDDFRMHGAVPILDLALWFGGRGYDRRAGGRLARGRGGIDRHQFVAFRVLARGLLDVIGVLGRDVAEGLAAFAWPKGRVTTPEKYNPARIARTRSSPSPHQALPRDAGVISSLRPAGAIRRPPATPIRPSFLQNP